MRNLLVALLILFSSCMQEVTVSGTIVEKTAVYSTGLRQIVYHTLIRTDDGYIQDVEGIQYYSLPIGSRTTIQVWREKPEK